ncbi:MAG: transcription elongation factor Spt5 [archaeon]
MPIYTIRTTVGRERTVLDSLDAKLKNNSAGIKAIMSPSELKGYFFIEGTEEDIHKAIQGIPHIKGIINKPIPVEELSNFYSQEVKEITIKEGDIVEVIGGPFKREKAKIVRIDETKREARIELVESAVPIPITIKLDLLKAIR